MAAIVIGCDRRCHFSPVIGITGSYQAGVRRKRSLSACCRLTDGGSVSVCLRSEGHDVEFRNANHFLRGVLKPNYTNFGRLRDAMSRLRGVIWLIRRRLNPGGADKN